jgi:hypothetical protein
MTRRGQIRWKIEGLQWPLDALVCPNGNVFVIHQSGNWLSMRDRHGKELWQKNVNQAFLCQRLRNGNIFVVCHQSWHEFDVNGKEVSSHMPNVGWIVGAAKFPNGHIGYVTQQGLYTRVDAAGKQVKTYQAVLNGPVAMNAEVLPGDHVLATTNTNRLMEFGDNGKPIWEANVINPGFPHRLLNGHTLVVQNGTTHLYELDRKGKVVSEKKDLECMPWRIRQR